MTKNAPIPDQALDDRLGFDGTSGSGKTYGAGVAAERLLARDSRLIAIDPLGVWWGLRLMADGKTPSPWNVVIFGGPHGDLAINEHAGGLIGETVAGMAESAIIDLSEIGTKAGERRFMLPFLTSLYRHASGAPVHLIFDEADMWAPQQVRDKDGEAAKLLGMMETVVRRGRIKGFIPWAITQRPAVLNKDILSQVDGLVSFKLTSSQDRDAIGNWVEGQADKDQWKQIRGDLAALPRGRAVIWLPGHGVLETADFPAKRTFDSSRTPKRGEKIKAAALKPLDVGALKTRLASVQVEAEANDPKRLKAKIADLERQISKGGAPAPAKLDPAAITAAEARGRQAGYEEGVRAGEARGEAKGREGVVGQAIAALKALAGGGKVAPAPPVRVAPAPPAVRSAACTVDTTYAARKQAANGHDTGEPLPEGERKCLIAIAQHANGVRREQLTVLTGYKRSTRDAYIQRLRNRGLIDQRGDRTLVTAAGVNALGSDYDPLPTGSALRERVLRDLPEGEGKVLGVLVSSYPDGVDREQISDATGFKRSTRDAYLQRLSRRELIDTIGRGEVKASDDLF